MNYTIVTEARELAGWNAESEALSIHQALMTLVSGCTTLARLEGMCYYK
jgi:hypothetical protein